ncbi:hypothetical protein SAMN04488105_1366 [Salipiger thiooxidans]|uniref:Uncharacterized protein n=1 Tax=Salipiger thiooxidans TaxID=282683 RepID=A0A1G7MK20_9RHOB|nr:hypothetical protein [Salipiger thiooxidans]SDF61499.1 hypothetical protein SAMN04488105_1366 [Salipiger thiooxidans]
MQYLPVAVLGAISIATTLSAQEIDIGALMADIETRSGQYEQLIGILQGTDTNRALAAFDAMVATGDPTMIEVAVNTGLSATDSRLRARALWEALSRKDAITLIIETSEIGEDEKAALGNWYGEIQTWPLNQKYPETQCINLYGRSSGCYLGRSLSVSGLRVDIKYDPNPGIAGQFALDEAGKLVGRVTSNESRHTYPATIEFR